MSANTVFQRVEKKYLLDEEKYHKFIKMTRDKITADDFGIHTICNIYYDTENDDLIARSIDKPVYKEKLRLRTYGIPNGNSISYIEIKKKYNGIVYKRRVQVPYGKAIKYLNKGVAIDSNNQIFREIDYLKKFYEPKPKLVLAYDRVAYYGSQDNNIRITIDRNIRSREYDMDLRLGDYGNSLLESNMYLMEIKVPASMPLWLVEILSELEIYPTSFSKYGNIYKQNKLNIRERGDRLCGQVC